MLGLLEEHIPRSVRVPPYVQGVGFIVTLEDTLEVPHIDVDLTQKQGHSWFLHCPLTLKGSYINIWDVEGKMVISSVKHLDHLFF